MALASGKDRQMQSIENWCGSTGILVILPKLTIAFFASAVAGLGSRSLERGRSAAV